MRFRRRRATVVDSHDAVVLRGNARRTLAVRVALGAAAVLLLAAAVASARGLQVEERTILPSASTGVVVLDLSLSISDGDYRLVREALQRLIDADARIGLVVFSDAPYELLPPGTPARELRPILPLLQPPRPGRLPNPWVETFRSGTRISWALDLAGEMLARERVANGSVLLLSDLQTAPDDVAALTRSAENLRRRSIPIQIVPLSPLSDGRLLFGQLLGEDAFVAPTQPGSGPRTLRTLDPLGLPVLLLALGGVFLVVLALNERYTGRLALPRGSA